MQSLQKQFHHFIEEQNLLEKGDQILLGVSGGLDSMVMATLFLKSDFSFSIAHCNYGLRGRDSDEDEAFVRKWGGKNQVPVYCKRIDLGDVSVQVAAREVRYKWFRHLSEEKGLDKIATAHHLNDSLETVLLNLVRGTGLKGLSGIAVKKETIIRPLLFASREQLQIYAQEEGISWREDVTNTQTDYDRNFVRLEVIPKLQQLNPSLLETFRLTNERLNYTRQLLQDEVKLLAERYLSKEENQHQLTLDWMKQERDGLLLSELLSEYGFNYVTAKQVFEAKGQAGKRFFSSDWEAVMDRSLLYIKQRKEQREEALMIEGVGCYQVGGKELTIQEVDSSSADFQAPNTEYLDANQAAFPWTIRPWCEGDRFRPLGMEGTKKVSDYLVDEKIPRSLKSDVKVVTSGDRIIWLVDHRLSEEVRIGPTSNRCLQVQWSDL